MRKQCESPAGDSNAAPRSRYRGTFNTECIWRPAAELRHDILEAFDGGIHIPPALLELYPAPTLRFDRRS